MRADGWQPYSFRVGDKWYSYARLDPFATTISVAADLATKAEGMTDRQLEDYSMLLVASIMKNLGDKTWLSGVSDFTEALSDSQRYGPSYLRRLAASGLIPNLSAQIARAVDPVQRDARTLTDELQARIPGLSDNLPAKRNIWGEPITSEGGIGPDVMSPVRVSRAKNDPVNAEMLAIGARFDTPDRFIKRDGERVDLTPEQYEKYSELAGRNTRQLIEGLMAQPGWSQLPKDARAERVRKAATAGKRAAREALFGGGDAKGSSEWPGEAPKASTDQWPGTPVSNKQTDGNSAPAEAWPGEPVAQRDVLGNLERVIPGIRGLLTSGFRTREYQAQMRRRGYRPADNSGHLDGSSLDIIVPRRRSMGWLMAQVKRAEPDAILLAEGDHLHATFPGWYGAPVLGGAKAAGLRNPMAMR
jgi:hypothetical protein